MATTVISAAFGGVATDDHSRCRLVVPPTALPVDVTVTIVAETIDQVGGRKVLGAWRIVAHPAPMLLASPATLEIAIPADAAKGDVALLIGDRTSWHPVGNLVPGGQWLKLQTWYMPPSHGPPPARSSTLVCLGLHV